MKYYHATELTNIDPILEQGIHKGIDGCVYMTKKPEESTRFLALRGVRTMGVIEINVPRKDKDKIEESFDHSFSFFKCRAWAYLADVPKEYCSLYGIYS